MFTELNVTFEVSLIFLIFL